MREGGGEGAEKGIELRRCTPADLPGVLEILKEAPEAAAWSAGALEDALRQPETCFLVAMDGAVVVGFLVGRQIADEGEILNLGVRRGRRRQGIGAALVRRLGKLLESKGVRRVFGEVRESNLGAVHFYMGLGFQQTGKRPNYYREPDEAALVLEARFGGNED
jgi:[ribosomal protein S18]-alanine N-acetyltransferase